VFEVQQSSVYSAWLRSLRDRAAKLRILVWIDRLQLGHLGDAKSVGEGIYELRMAFGPGYRIYFSRRGERVILLLCGGDKDRQQRDIARAKQINADWE
jgi:putative addiction module killer protein